MLHNTPSLPFETCLVSFMALPVILRNLSLLPASVTQSYQHQCRLHRLHFPSPTGLISEAVSVFVSSTCGGIRHQTMVTEVMLSRPYHCDPVPEKPYNFPILISVLWSCVRQHTIPRNSSQIPSDHSSSSKPGQRYPRKTSPGILVHVLP
jgi:hypothetical protein